jgi:hypothetical protein
VVPTHQTELHNLPRPLLGFSLPTRALANLGEGKPKQQHELRVCHPAATPNSNVLADESLPPPPTHPPTPARRLRLAFRRAVGWHLTPQGRGPVRRESEAEALSQSREMKKLCQGGKKGRRVHPAPADADAAVALPAAVLALASALTAEEQEVLAYLLSCGGAAVVGGRPRRRRGPHPPEMGCACFGCYKSFWARWDASPNRHLIHRIIDAVEEEGGAGAPRRPPRRRRRGGGAGGGRRGGGDAADEDAAETGPGVDHDNLPACDGGSGMDMDHRCHGEYDGDGDGDEEEEETSSVDGDDASVDSEGGGSAEKSTVGRLVRFIGEKVWGAWN